MMDHVADQTSHHHHWTSLPGEAESSAGWAHHGVAVTEAGLIVTFDAAGDDVLIFTSDGAKVNQWATGLTEGHCLTTTVDQDGEHVWIADPGSKMEIASPGSYRPVTRGAHGRVAKFDLNGQLILELSVPVHPAYAHGRFSPTAVVVDSTSRGGSGKVWVADGYGANLVHVYDADGEYFHTLAGEFDCPHGLLIDRRHAEAELYVADRENHRLQIYGLDGEFRRTGGEGLLRRPSALATHGDQLIVAELEARLAILDANDDLVRYVGADDTAPSRSGWPNAISADGQTVRPDLEPGIFNSPHGVAVSGDGHLLVAEWLIGGRVNKLSEDAPPQSRV